VGYIGSKTAQREQDNKLLFSLLSSIWVSMCQSRNSPNPFSEFAVHRRMYGKVSRSSILSFLSYIDHGVAIICQFIEIR
jgi:hypothetical protein